MSAAIRGLFAALLCLVAFASKAMSPEDGIWYNPEQSGRGWVITSINDTMAVSTYTYAASGAPVWFLSTGTYNDASRSFSGQLNGQANGQCIGCPYQAPISTGSAGSLSIQFIDAENAVLTQAGEMVPIKKLFFGFASLDDRMYGEWTYAGNVALGIGDAEFLVMNSTFTASSGKRYVSFRRKFTTVGVGLVAYEPALGEYLALLDSSTSYYKAYRFSAEGSRILDGRWWLYLKTGSISGAGDYFTGHRTAEKNDVGAAVVNDAIQKRERIDLATAETMEKAVEPADPKIAAMFLEIERSLEEMRGQR